MYSFNKCQGWQLLHNNKTRKLLQFIFFSVKNLYHPGSVIWCFFEIQSQISDLYYLIQLILNGNSCNLILIDQWDFLKILVITFVHYLQAFLQPLYLLLSGQLTHKQKLFTYRFLYLSDEQNNDQKILFSRIRTNKHKSFKISSRWHRGKTNFKTQILFKWRILLSQMNILKLCMTYSCWWSCSLARFDCIFSLNFFVNENCSSRKKLFLKVSQIGSRTINKKMFRVVLKVEKAHIRVKEPMNLETVLRKNNWHMVIPGGAAIKSGIAHFNCFIEFYVSKEKPDFILDLVVSLGQTKKFGGRCSIDLSQLSPLTSHHLMKKLQKCPDEKSTLQLDILFMQSNLNYLGKDLLSLHQIQTQVKNQMIRQMWEKQILTQERFGLARQNEQLFHGQFAIRQDMQDKITQFQSQIFRRAVEVERIEKDLVKEQEKIAKMVNIINESHNTELVQKMTEILNRSQY